jgi:head-tail adaptor
VSIGTLNVRASLQRAVQTPDGGGGFFESWAQIAELWIGLAPSNGADSFGPDRLESRVHYRVTARRGGDLAAGLRLVTSAHTLSIQAVLDEGPRAEFVTLFCEDVP